MENLIQWLNELISRMPWWLDAVIVILCIWMLNYAVHYKEEEE